MRSPVPSLPPHLNYPTALSTPTHLPNPIHHFHISSKFELFDDLLLALLFWAEVEEVPKSKLAQSLLLWGFYYSFLGWVVGPKSKSKGLCGGIGTCWLEFWLLLSTFCCPLPH